MDGRRFAVVVVLVLGFVGTGWARAQSCRDVPAEHQAIVDVMRAMFAGAASKDAAAVEKVLAPEFYAFDNGRAFHGMELFRVLKTNYLDHGYVFVWTVTDPEVHTACNTAWITYTNVGSITAPHGKAAPAQWLESAVLEKQHGHWLIRFFHSTLMASPPPAGK